MDTPRTLVVLYSRTGTTKIVGTKISEMLHCDVEELVDRRRRTGLVGYLRSSLDATLRRRTRLAPTSFNPAEYDLVIIGTPVWNASVSAPVRTYLAENYGRMRRIAFFCTHGGKWSERALAQMERICRKKPVTTLVLRTAEVSRGGIDAKIRTFVETARAAQTAIPSAPEPPRGIATPGAQPA